MKQTKPKFLYNIDVVGACNLKCPTCPNGNSMEVRNPTGFMKEETLKMILDKAVRDTEVEGVCLYNWYEPLLHPKLPELIKLVNSYGVKCYLSSNLNILKNPDAVLAANPFSLRISISGFNQSNYGITHQGGDVEKVKANMRLLAEAHKRVASTTIIHVYYHRYLGNLDDEVQLRHLAKELNFEFRPGWAYLMPLEKVMAVADPSSADVELSSKDHEMIDRLAMPLNDVLAAAKKNRDIPCILKDQQTTIDFQGRVQLCCGVFDFTKYTLGNFIDHPHQKLQEMKDAHSMCTKCMKNGLHAYLVCNVPGLERMIKLRVYKHYADNEYSMEFPGLVGLAKSKVANGIRSTRRVVRKIQKSITEN